MFPIPLTLYIHIPWCVRKCPYCDFNSHTLKADLPEEQYIDSLLADLVQDLSDVQNRQLTAIFIGGGTPSLFSSESIQRLLKGIGRLVDLADRLEVTLEANPGTVEQNRFVGFKSAGITRLSMGIQSFQVEQLNALGRIHDDQEAFRAIMLAQAAGFDRYNLDLMYGLPGQTIEHVLEDLRIALSFNPPHLSWYQLTLEPNTPFFHTPPVLPTDDAIWEMHRQGQIFLANAGLIAYEISAYTRTNELKQLCRHNVNYWEFGDYLGIGAGAHSKITDIRTHQIKRSWKIRHPKDYLLKNRDSFVAGSRILADHEKAFEFMLNALRLYQPISIALFQQRTGLDVDFIEPILQQAQQRRLLVYDGQTIMTTALGKRYLNDLLGLFLS